MQYTLATLALVAAARVANAQGVAAGIAPASAPPAGCSTTYASKFEITVVLPAMKRDVIERRDACGGAGTLVASLTGGVLTDAVGRIGSIVANGQFQFDGPPAQTGAVYTGGWSVCSNGSLALGGSGVFYQCLSGGFYNLYDKSIGAQCSPVEIDVIPCTVGGATQIPDGQVQNPSATTKITQISDGQIQATSAGPHVTQISDGQIQATSAAVRPPPVSQYTDGQIQVTAMPTYRPPPVSQITDGQIQAPTSKPVVVSQITDGQIQAPTTKPVVVSQITDGQIQAPTTKPAVVSQITDGQIQAPTTKPVMTTKPAVVSQITDGQIQAPTTIVTRPLVSQITDGQVQAPNATATPTKPVPGSASRMTMGASIVAAALAVVVFAVL